MKIKINIDSNTVRKNPDAGRDSFIVPGTAYQTSAGWEREYSIVRTLSPEPNYLYSYSQALITCPHCTRVCYHTDLIEVEEDDFFIHVCPECGNQVNCDFDFESIEEFFNRKEENK